jgi:hypothetical protein
MHRFGPGPLGRLEDRGDPQVGVGSRAGTYIEGAVCKFRVHRIDVEVRIDGYGLDVEVAACAYQTHCDLTAVGYQELSEHRSVSYVDDVGPKA